MTPSKGHRTPGREEQRRARRQAALRERSASPALTALYDLFAPSPRAKVRP